MFDRIGLEREIIRRRGFSEFVRRAWRYVEPGKPFVERWYHRATARACEEASLGLASRKIIVNQPPATLKSTIVSVLWPAWHWAHVSPSHGILGASYDQRLVVRDAKKMLELVRSRWYRSLWPHVRVPDSAGVTDYSNSQGGFRISASIGGKITGRHPRIRLVDDPAKPIRATPSALDQINVWYGGTWASRADEPKDVIEAVVMQRLGANDLSAHLESLGEHRVIRFGAEYRQAASSPEDERTEEGALLDEDRLSAEFIAKQKIAMGADFEIQYNQHVVDSHAKLFDRSYIDLVDLPPHNEVQLYLISVDCSFKGTEGSDLISVQCWALHKGTFVLVDVIRGRRDFLGTIEAIGEMMQRWPFAYVKIVEDKANGPAVINVMGSKFPGFTAVNPLGGKVARANSVSPLHRLRNVKVRRAQSWTEEVLYQWDHFPRVQYDDDTDAMTQALAWAMLNGYGQSSEEYINLDNLRSLYHV